MVQYKVPQNVQREDQVLWFITLRQLIILMIGFGISYWIFTHTNQNTNQDKQSVDAVSQMLMWLPAALAVAFAFVKIKSIPLFQFLLLLMENTFFRRPRRWWIAGSGYPFVSMTTNIDLYIKKKKEKLPVEKNVNNEKIKKLAQYLDSQKSEFDPSNKNKTE